MAVRSNFSAARDAERLWIRWWFWINWKITVGGSILAILAITLHALVAQPPVSAKHPLDTAHLHALVSEGDGALAVQFTAAEAAQRGGWAAAPGESLAYDAELARPVRGAVRIVDVPPVECSDPRLHRLTARCTQELTHEQNLVRFGCMTFSDLDSDGTLTPRALPDDILATYIEEVGHSWQEYLYETEGRASGPRTRAITWDDSLYFTPGWEYQVKRYILSLDGVWLRLSDEYRAELTHAICKTADGVSTGYANPSGHAVLSYGPPPGWPNSAGWPLGAPSAGELAAFCTS